MSYAEVIKRLSMPPRRENDKMSQRKLPRSTRSQDLQFNIETERETDGRWIAEIQEIPGALAYGKTEKQAKARAYAIALRAIADDVEKSKRVPQSVQVPTAGFPLL